MNTCKFTFRLQPRTINRQRRTHNRTDVKNNKKTSRMGRLQRCQLMHPIVSNQLHRVHFDGVICPRRRHSWGESLALFLYTQCIHVTVSWHDAGAVLPKSSCHWAWGFLPRPQFSRRMMGLCQLSVIFDHPPPLPRAFAQRHTLMSHRQELTSPRIPLEDGLKFLPSLLYASGVSGAN